MQVLLVIILESGTYQDTQERGRRNKSWFEQIFSLDKDSPPSASLLPAPQIQTEAGSTNLVQAVTPM